MGITFKKKKILSSLYLCFALRRTREQGNEGYCGSRVEAYPQFYPRGAFGWPLWSSVAWECRSWLDVAVTGQQEPTLFPQPADGEVIKAEVLHKI